MEPPWSPSQYAHTVESLRDFALEDSAELQRARALLVGPDGDVEEWLAEGLLAWLTLGQEDAQGRRAVERFRAQHPEGARTAGPVLDALAAAWCSLFEVRAVLPDRRLELLDLLSGERLCVQEQAPVETVRHDLLIAWVLPAGGHLALAGGGLWVPRSHLRVLVPEFREALARARARAPGEDVRVHQRRLAGPLCAREVALDAEPRPVVNMDDEPFRPCTSRFRVSDVAEVAQALERHPRFERDDAHTFSWLDAAGRPELGEGLLLLGLVRLRPGEVVLETNSLGRLERGRALLAQVLGPGLRHEEDSVGEQAVTHSELEDAPAALEGETRARLAETHRRYLAHFADLPLPLLGGASPREAVHTRRGRAQVLLLLADVENHLAWQASGEAVDLGPVYTELGLERDEVPDLDAAFSGTGPEPRPPVRMDASRLPPSRPEAERLRRGKAPVAPPVEPGGWFAFKLGPIPLEQGDVNAYVAFASDTLKSHVVFDTRDADGVARLARKLAGRAVSCEPRLGRLGRKHGFVSRPLPGELMLVRATLALAFAWGPAADEVLPEHIGELLLTAAALWEAAPWRRWDNEACFTATLSGALEGERELMVLGNGGEEFGFVLFDEAGGHGEMSGLARSERYEAASRIPCLALNYDEWPEFAAEAVEDATGMPRLPAPLRLTREGPGLADLVDVRLLTATARALRDVSPERPEGHGEAGAGAERVAVRVKAPPPEG
jgi:hypothetical protein